MINIYKKIFGDKEHKGAALLNMLMYIGLMATAFTIVGAIVVNIFSYRSRLFALEEVNQNGRFALETISKMIRNAEVVSNPVAGNSDESLALTMPSSFCGQSANSYCADEDGDGYFTTNNELCNSMLEVEANGNIIAPAGEMTVTVIDSQMTYGEDGPEVDGYVTLKKNGVYTQLFNHEDVDGGEEYTTNLEEVSNIAIKGEAKYFTQYYSTYTSDMGDGHTLVLRTGDDMPDIPAVPSQDDIRTILAPFIDENDKIDIDNNQIFLMFELGSETTGPTADFQDLVVLLTFSDPCDCGAFDCDDSDPDINPGIPEICGDETDNNCNFFIDEAMCVVEGGGSQENESCGEEILFDVSEGRLRMKIGDQDYTDLTSNQVGVSNIQFTNVSYLGSPGTIRVDLTLFYKNLAGLADFNAEKTFKTTINAR